MERHPILTLVLKRSISGAVLVIVVATLIFAIVEILPGDAVTAVLGRAATPQVIENLRYELGLDRPPHERYVEWIGGLATGDLGTSMVSRRPVTELISGRFRNTIVLATLAALFLIPLSLTLGMFAGTREGTRLDNWTSSVMLGLATTPEFVVGTLLAFVLGVHFHILPPVSLFDPAEGPLSRPSILVLPALTMALVGSGYAARIVRASIAEALKSQHVVYARLHGLAERRVLWRYAFRNALAPSIQMMALLFQYLIGGVLIVEVVFQYPGIGQLLVGAAAARDVPLLQSIIVIIAAIYIAINVVTDVIIVLVTPKLRTSL